MSRRIAVLADVGQRAYHVGDEAIAVAAVTELERRGAGTLVITRDATAMDRALHGRLTVGTVNVPWDPAERGALLRDIIEGEGTRRGRQALARSDVASLVDALCTVDALHIAGGGNHNSLYGWLLTERAIAVHLAIRLGLPVTLTGQTLGPSLHEADRDALARELRALSFLSVRDRASARLARELTGGEVDVRVSVDDATFLADLGDMTTRSVAPDHISATFSGDYLDLIGPDGERELGRALRHVSGRLGLPVRFEAHMQVRGEHSGDAIAHARLAEMIPPGRVIIEPVRDALDVARSMRSAALVVSSRFHPIVFASAAGVPVVALGGTHYADVRLDGVLDSWGLDGFRIPPALVLDGDLTDRVDQVVDAAASIRAHLRAQAPSLRRQWDATWDAVLTPGQVPLPAQDPSRLSAPWGLPPAGQAVTDRVESEREKLAVELDLAQSLLRARQRPSGPFRGVARALRRA